MDIKTLIKQIMVRKHIKISNLAQICEANPRTLSNLLASKNSMRLDKLEQIADALDCDIVLQDKNTGEIYK